MKCYRVKALTLDWSSCVFAVSRKKALSLWLKKWMMTTKTVPKEVRVTRFEEFDGEYYYPIVVDEASKLKEPTLFWEDL